jgi:hypothetical protein
MQGTAEVGSLRSASPLSGVTPLSMEYELAIAMLRYGKYQVIFVLMAAVTLLSCEPEPVPASGWSYQLALDNCADANNTAAAIDRCALEVWQKCEREYHPCPNVPTAPLLKIDTAHVRPIPR